MNSQQKTSAKYKNSLSNFLTISLVSIAQFSVLQANAMSFKPLFNLLGVSTKSNVEPRTIQSVDQLNNNSKKRTDNHTEKLKDKSNDKSKQPEKPIDWVDEEWKQELNNKKNSPKPQPKPVVQKPKEQKLEDKKTENSVVVDSDDHVRMVQPLWESEGLDKKEWSEHVYRELAVIGTDLINTVPSDSYRFCPNYKELTQSERKEYWTFFISTMAKFESGFDVQEAHTEAFTNSKNARVISRGLLQISLESGKSYGCDLRRESDLHNPFKNLSCGIRILNRWVKADRRIGGQSSTGQWLGGARYWSVLRAARKDSYTSIVKWNSSLPFCRK